MYNSQHGIEAGNVLASKQNLHHVYIEHLFYPIAAKHKDKVMKSSQHNAYVYIQGVLESREMRQCRQVNLKVFWTHMKHRDTNVYYKYILEHKSCCEPLQDMSTQDTMKVHLLCNTGVTGSREIFSSWTFQSSFPNIYIP